MKFSVERKGHYYIIGKHKIAKYDLDYIINLIESNPDYIIYKASQKYRKLN